MNARDGRAAADYPDGGRWVSMRPRRRPLRARITRPPPPKLLGEVGGGAGIADRRRTSSWRRRGAPPPAPPRSFLAERGEFDPGPISIMLAATHKPATPQARAHTTEPPARKGGLRVAVAANSFAIAEPAGSGVRRRASNWRLTGPPLPLRAGERENSLLSGHDVPAPHRNPSAQADIAFSQPRIHSPGWGRAPDRRLASSSRLHHPHDDHHANARMAAWTPWTTCAMRS
jgi:hypothetical protein